MDLLKIETRSQNTTHVLLVFIFLVLMYIKMKHYKHEAYIAYFPVKVYA